MSGIGTDKPSYQLPVTVPPPQYQSRPPMVRTIYGLGAPLTTPITITVKFQDTRVKEEHAFPSIRGRFPRIPSSIYRQQIPGGGADVVFQNVQYSFEEKEDTN